MTHHLKTPIARKLLELESSERQNALKEIYLPPSQYDPKDDLLLYAFLEDPTLTQVPQQESYLKTFLSRAKKLMYWSTLPALGAAILLLVQLTWFEKKAQPKQTGLKKAPFGKRQTHTTRYIPKGTTFEIKMFYARHNKKGSYGQTQQLQKSGATFFPNDELQFAYQTKKPTHTMIVGINDKGEVYTLFVGKNGESTLLKKGSGTLSNSGRSFRLDDYVGQERFYVLYANKSFNWKVIKHSLLSSWNKSNKNIKQFSFVPKNVQHHTVWIHRKKRPN